VSWWTADQVYGGYAVMVPAWFDPPGAAVTIRAKRGMREGWIYRWNGRTLSRDQAYERRVAAAQRGWKGNLQERLGNLRVVL